MGSAVGEITGANKKAARAAGKAAMARQEYADAALDEAKSFGQQSIDAIKGTPEEIRRMEASLANQEKNIAREEQLLSSIDPALIEASNQVLKLLRGEESSAIDPVRKQRQRQRQRLMDSLREQFGAGAESSSAGVQALTAFDAETDSLISNAQQQSIGQLFGATSSILPSLSNARGLASSRLQSAIGSRQGALSSAFMGAGQLNQAARSAGMGATGSQFVESGLRAGQMQQLGSEAFKVGMTAAMGGFGGPAGAAAGASSTSAAPTMAAGGPAFDPSRFMGMA